MVYPKRRAPMACGFCCQRKRRCSGERPSCRLCKSSGIPCQYSEVPIEEGQAQTQDTLNSELLRRLEHLESIVHQQQEQLDSSHAALAQSESASSVASRLPGMSAGNGDGLNLGDDEGFRPTQFATFLSLVMPDFDGFSLRQQPDFLANLLPGMTPECDSPQSNTRLDNDTPTIIPYGHHTITASMFALEPIKALVGEYPPDFFFQIESSQPLSWSSPPCPQVLQALASRDHDGRYAEALISNYFSTVQPFFPILDPGSFTAFFRKRVQGVNGCDMEAAVCLMVLALGELAVSDASDHGSQREEDIPGMQYFACAHQLLTRQWVVDLTADLFLTSGLILAAIYLLYLARPLSAWHLVHMASSRLQLLVTQSEIRSRTQSEIDFIGRLCWACFVLECDSLAEFHLPRSGIEFTIDRMQLPRLNVHNSRDGMLFLALCSIRRLLNRIHHSVYTSSTKAALSAASPLDSTGKQSSLMASAFAVIKSLESVLMELSHQVDTWYSSLPDLIRPDLTNNNPADKSDAWLRLRYWSAKHIIGRPCLFYAASVADPLEVPLYVLKLAEMCIECSRNFIETAVVALKSRTVYSWMVVQALMAYSFTLTIASKSPILQHLVPDLNDLIGKSIACLQRWATSDSTAESIVLILKILRRKRQLL